MDRPNKNGIMDQPNKNGIMDRPNKNGTSSMLVSSVFFPLMVARRITNFVLVSLGLVFFYFAISQESSLFFVFALLCFLSPFSLEACGL